MRVEPVKIKVRKKSKLKIFLSQKYLFLMILPSFVLMFLFCYVPMGGASIAFKNFNPIHGIWGSQWVGFANFEKLFANMFFKRVFINTVVISLLQILWGFPAPIIFALFLNEIQNRWFKRTIQTISYLPHFISWVIIGGFLVNLLSSSQGIVKPILEIFGKTYDTPLLARPDAFRTILVTSGIWKGMGWGSIIYLAAMTSIDTELYEAASIDGAGRFSKMWHITLPGIIPTIITLFILRLGRLLGSNFEQIYVLYSPSVYKVGDVISTYVFREGLGKGNFSYTTAMGLFQSVIGFALVVTTNAISRRLGKGMW